MKSKYRKRWLHKILVFLLMLTNSLQVFAAEDRVEFIDQTKQIEVKDDNDLFSGMKELVPGSKETTTIHLSNTSSNKITYYLYAKETESPQSLQLSKEYNSDLLALLQITVKTGNQVIYQGPLSGNPKDAKEGQITNGSMLLSESKNLYGIELGTLKGKESKDLTVELSIPRELGNEYQQTFTTIDWVFTAYYEDGITPTQKPPENLPKTGSGVIYFVEVATLLGILVVGLVTIQIVIMKKRRLN